MPPRRLSQRLSALTGSSRVPDSVLARDSPAVVVLLSERGTSSGSHGLSQTCCPVAGSSADSQAPLLGPHRVLTEHPCLEPPGTASVALRLLRPHPLKLNWYNTGE
ncbi:hypothetical protein NDU88_001508 [Pleurodeles waltl]|uniref:Ig-like domain-containing protein n=1 Tax=Pleurodeles waltl TaxID=8319 RepID=A0AAV7MKM5_PLEWA|nr:hypothetical protein NDU88_001508 [Pleurodeles waltl]